MPREPYKLLISEEAREQLRALPNELCKNIGYRLHLMRHELSGDVRRLEGTRRHYRLRIGQHRILFRLEGDTIEVYAVKQRKDAYE